MFGRGLLSSFLSGGQIWGSKIDNLQGSSKINRLSALGVPVRLFARAKLVIR